MKITDSYLTQAAEFEKAQITVPKYDDAKVKENTLSAPRWVHFGGGNLFRCFHAQVAQDLLNQGELDSGIVVVETFGKDLIDDIYHGLNNRSLSVTMKVDGSFNRELVASTGQALYLNKSNQPDVDHLVAAFKNTSLQMVTLTITEKGYAVKDSAGQLLASVNADIAAGPKFTELKTTMAQIAYLLFERFTAGELPIAVVSTDNFSHNGDRVKQAIATIAEGWVAAGLAPKAFTDYLFTSGKVSFPYSMIDRITPGPNEEIAKGLEADGIEEMLPYETPQGMHLAAFVNTEETHYLAIEDNFPNGRPALEKASGMFLADRETVNKADLMKVTTCLNPLHTALAVLGCLLGFDRIYTESQDKDLLKLIEKIGFVEGLPVVENPGIIDPEKFINEVIYTRFMNPNIPDAPQRIASDTSQKMGIRYGETIKSYVAHADLNPADLIFIPFVIAAWCRYLMAIDDKGNSFTPSPDPLYGELHEHVKGIQLGDTVDAHRVLQPILQNAEIFGVDLYQVGLGEKIEGYFNELITGPEAVRTTLQRLLKEHA
jgi:fructuronate reductase